MNIGYVNKDFTPLYAESTGTKANLQLLWGDRLRILEDTGTSDRVNAKARGKTGFVKRADIGEKSLLEVYFIDVGQGDGILICTPARRHILIDGGYRRKYQPTGKSVADFVDWKFAKDYEAEKIVLDAMIASHCDADHYGGLWDLINPNETNELDLEYFDIKAFYHAGVSWWKDTRGKRSLGPIKDNKLTLLLEDKASVNVALKGNPADYSLQGEWAEFMQNVVDVCNKISRLSVSNFADYVPGFSPANSDAALKVLAPLETSYQGKPALPSLGDESQNTNGNSILLRLDYGRTRILLTGDLNRKSQNHLLESYVGRRQEFACDVAKGCHHGSDDVSYEFLANLSPAATIISSGDEEGHSHPRPNIVSASALTGHIQIEEDEVITPLVYSTEIARSVRFGKAYEIETKGLPGGTGGKIKITVSQDPNTVIRYKEKAAGDLQARVGSRTLKNLYVVGGVRYGLVNVRTDGNKILCATLNEKKNTWDIKTFFSRF
jgi:beta-lactamase superfamily II metal-dependent hydrolase